LSGVKNVMADGYASLTCVLLGVMPTVAIRSVTHFWGKAGYLAHRTVMLTASRTKTATIRNIASLLKPRANYLANAKLNG